MIPYRFLCALAVALALPALPALAASAKKAPAPKAAREGKFAGLPGPVVATLHALQGKGQIGEVSREVEEGETVFEVDIAHGADTRTYTLDAEGVQLNVELFSSEVPAPVMAAIKTESGGGRVEFISRSVEEGHAVYDVQITKGGKKAMMIFAAAGTLIGRQVSLGELPAKIQEAVKAQLTGGKLGSLFQGPDAEGDPSYTGAGIRSGRTRWFTLDDDGRLISEEEKIVWTEVPAPVRQAIANHLGGTDHVRVSRVKEEDRVRFDVLAMRGAELTAFSVRPDGKVSAANDP